MLQLTAYGVRAFDPGGFAAQRRRLVGAQVLRGARADRFAARSQRTSALLSRGATPDRLHRLRAEDRIVARGDRRGTRETSRRPDTDTRGLVAHVRRVDERIDQKIAELQRLRAGLTQCI